MKKSDLFWHYTTGEKFIQIVECGFIIPATAGVPKGERPVVWFSSNTFWEPTASKAWKSHDGTIKDLGMNGTMEAGGGLARFGFTTAIANVTWDEFVRTSGINKETAENLAKIGVKAGSGPNFWRARFGHAAVSDCKRIDVFHGGKWVEVEQ